LQFGQVVELLQKHARNEKVLKDGTGIIKLEVDIMENLEAAKDLLAELQADKHDTRTTMRLDNLQAQLSAIRTDISLLERRLLEAQTRQDCYAKICEGLLNRLAERT